MKSKYWAAVLALVLAGSLGISLFVGRPGTPAKRAEIVSDGKLIRTVALSEDQEFTLPSPDGGYNTITVRDGKIAVTEADCPDHYCVKQGFCDSGVQIVCLPHKLVISFLESEDIDGAVG